MLPEEAEQLDADLDSENIDEIHFGPTPGG